MQIVDAFWFFPLRSGRKMRRKGQGGKVLNVQKSILKAPLHPYTEVSSEVNQPPTEALGQQDSYASEHSQPGCLSHLLLQHSESEIHQLPTRSVQGRPSLKNLIQDLAWSQVPHLFKKEPYCRIYRPPWGLSSKESTHKAGCSLIPGLGRSPRGGHDIPLQYHCLENSMDRRACWNAVHRVARSLTGLK